MHEISNMPDHGSEPYQQADRYHHTRSTALDWKDGQPIRAFHVVSMAMDQFAQDGAHVMRAVDDGETAHRGTGITELFTQPLEKANISSVHYRSAQSDGFRAELENFLPAGQIVEG